ncbi:hypothetical protein [Humibacillus sp. DSM 29435]|uniref:hypothetical protein n=1 Tax=Humibacillus sp. DSM 29435 TaxID=1869167 RepID=UPI00111317A0|nr:hypothetical protein [Humibacillus sp. DSM 29435]
MNEVLEQALAPVLQDLSGAGVSLARIEEENWTGLEDRPSAMVWSTDGSGFGIGVDRLAPSVQHQSAVWVRPVGEKPIALIGSLRAAEVAP